LRRYKTKKRGVETTAIKGIECICEKQKPEGRVNGKKGGESETTASKKAKNLTGVKIAQLAWVLKPCCRKK